MKDLEKALNNVILKRQQGIHEASMYVWVVSTGRSWQLTENKPFRRDEILKETLLMDEWFIQQIQVIRLMFELICRCGTLLPFHKFDTLPYSNI